MMKLKDHMLSWFGAKRARHMDTRCNVLQLLGHWDLHPEPIWGFFGANDRKDILKENTKSCKRALGFLCFLCFLCPRFVCTIDLPFCTVNIENLQNSKGLKLNWNMQLTFFSSLLLCCLQPAWWACGWALTSRLRLRIREETAESATVLPHGRGLGRWCYATRFHLLTAFYLPLYSIVDQNMHTGLI